MGLDLGPPPEAVVIEASPREAIEPRPGLVLQPVVAEEPSDREHPSIDVERVLRELLGLLAREVGGGTEQVDLDGPFGVRVAQEPAGHGPGRVAPEDRISHHQVHGDIQAPGPFPLARLVAAPIGRVEPRRLEDLGSTRLIEVRGVSRVNLGESEHEGASHDGQPRVAAGFRLRVILRRAVEGRLR